MIIFSACSLKFWNPVQRFCAISSFVQGFRFLNQMYFLVAIGNAEEWRLNRWNRRRHTHTHTQCPNTLNWETDVDTLMIRWYVDPLQNLKWKYKYLHLEICTQSWLPPAWRSPISRTHNLRDVLKNKQDGKLPRLDCHHQTIHKEDFLPKMCTFIQFDYRKLHYSLRKGDAEVIPRALGGQKTRWKLRT